ncbi:DUF1294 domain-containing protein [Chryseobacterium sp. SSA4.19]|uniref:DUF1294 domain-containing protein n=1 Tax=Chryseobacterium sp. SSA4.19 TaxID=2919915 RepID=UPI001F4DC47C|nr:DUF1294 domain-containing protein [Chryseobacterium sp. SSA4.19]MCJ8154853.1 DUF1294 domain-containing protein [Chryseobacterium sp. SSA4.19]
MFYVLLLINLMTFILFGIDKRKAVRHQRRISEASLLACTFLGGTIGAIAGMLIFRHKVSKKSFLVKFGLVLLVQAVVIYLLTVIR